MVEKIAVCWWRQKSALNLDAKEVPADQPLEQVLRYKTSAQRQLAHAINQLEATTAHARARSGSGNTSGFN